MSFNVLVVPEDVRHDQYMVKPLLEKLLVEVGKPNATVEVCQDPRFRGFEDVRQWSRLQLEVLDRYRGVHLVVLCVDRDGQVGREDALEALETKASDYGRGARLLAVVAHQEMEVWVLAGCADFRPRDFGADSWEDVREERHPKERFFEPFAEERGVAGALGGGRRLLGLEAGAAYTARVRTKCPELAALEQRIENEM